MHDEDDPSPRRRLKRKRRAGGKVLGAKPMRRIDKRARGGGVAEVHPLVRSAPEPRAHIAAQIRAMADPQHVKDAVFVARGNEAAIPRRLPRGVHAVERREGVLLTTNLAKARAFARKPAVDDRDLAQLLGLPESKGDVMAAALRGDAVTTHEAHDARGRTIAEALSSGRRSHETAAAIGAQVPAGGRLVSDSIHNYAARKAPRFGAGGVRRRQQGGELEQPEAGGQFGPGDAPRPAWQRVIPEQRGDVQWGYRRGALADPDDPAGEREMDQIGHGITRSQLQLRRPGYKRDI
ncbi:MAG: hypothetical protein ACLQJR_05220 [Stellaceae bacterium]